MKPKRKIKNKNFVQKTLASDWRQRTMKYRQKKSEFFKLNKNLYRIILLKNFQQNMFAENIKKSKKRTNELDKNLFFPN